MEKQVNIQNEILQSQKKTPIKVRRVKGIFALYAGDIKAVKHVTYFQIT